MKIGNLGSPLGTVTHTGTDLGSRVAYNDPQFSKPRRNEVLHYVVEDRLIGNWDQLLGTGVGEWSHATPAATRQDQALHTGEGTGGP